MRRVRNSKYVCGERAKKQKKKYNLDDCGTSLSLTIAFPFSLSSSDLGKKKHSTSERNRQREELHTHTQKQQTTNHPPNKQSLKRLTKKENRNLKPRKPTAFRSAATAFAKVSFSPAAGSNTVTSSASGAVSLAASAKAAGSGGLARATTRHGVRRAARAGGGGKSSAVHASYSVDLALLCRDEALVKATLSHMYLCIILLNDRLRQKVQEQKRCVRLIPPFRPRHVRALTYPCPNFYPITRSTPADLPACLPCGTAKTFKISPRRACALFHRSSEARAQTL